MKKRALQTTVGTVHPDALAYTAGRDIELDQALVSADCAGTAAHVTMLSRMPVKPRLISGTERNKIVRELAAILRDAARGSFRIGLEDQDVHLAVERRLTAKLGELGKKVHTGRSRNDQVAVALQIFTKEQLLATMEEGLSLVQALLDLARRHRTVPMVGRTHMQPAMPSSVGLWASAFAENLLDDLELLPAAYRQSDRCALGAAAGYGVPLPIDRKLTARLLGFEEPSHNVLYASVSRGRNAMVALAMLSGIMTTLSSLAQDLLLYSLPEFGYFLLPAAYGTGSSIMPQKRNPDVLELVRARAGAVAGEWVRVMAVLKGLPSGYNRDLQETKEPLMRGFDTTRASLRILAPVIRGMKTREKALLAGFTPAVFATDAALDLVRQGVPFRDAYRRVKTSLDELTMPDPGDALARKKHWGAPAGLDFKWTRRRVDRLTRFAEKSRRQWRVALKRLFGGSFHERRH
ncbi:MAG: argininosuccinate lyase [Lentisphaerae bacterium]|nr:argininosuccinate lyase [Lentisphaerota bacterium]